MKVNGVDVANYISGFDRNTWESALQILEVFGCCKEVGDALNQMKREYTEAVLRESKRVNDELNKRASNNPKPPCRGKVVEAPTLRYVVGICSECSGKLRGEPVEGCSKTRNTRAKTRVFIKECSNCTYYSEVFKVGNKFSEVEGGN